MLNYYSEHFCDFPGIFENLIKGGFTITLSDTCLDYECLDYNRGLEFTIREVNRIPPNGTAFGIARAVSEIIDVCAKCSVWPDNFSDHKTIREACNKLSGITPLIKYKINATFETNSLFIAVLEYSEYAAKLRVWVKPPSEIGLYEDMILEPPGVAILSELPKLANAIGQLNLLAFEIEQQKSYVLQILHDAEELRRLKARGAELDYVTKFLNENAEIEAVDRIQETVKKTRKRLKKARPKPDFRSY